MLKKGKTEKVLKKSFIVHFFRLMVFFIQTVILSYCPYSLFRLFPIVSFFLPRMCCISISQAELWDIATGIPVTIGTCTGGRRLTIVGVSPSRAGASSTMATVFFRFGVAQSYGSPSFPSFLGFLCFPWQSQQTRACTRIIFVYPLLHSFTNERSKHHFG